MPEAYVLDSFALLAYFHDEPGSQRIEDLLRRSGASTNGGLRLANLLFQRPVVNVRLIYPVTSLTSTHLYRCFSLLKCENGMWPSC